MHQKNMLRRNDIYIMVCLFVMNVYDLSYLVSASVVYDSRLSSPVASNVDVIQRPFHLDQQVDDIEKWSKIKGEKEKLEELRCHCNLPICVTTGYMCKSALGICFSEIVDRTDLSKSRHGCLELFSSDKTEACHNQPRGEQLQQHGHHHHHHHQTQQQQQQQQLHKPLVLCCQDDLCNYSAQEVEWRMNSAVRGRNESHGGYDPHSVVMETRVFGDLNAMNNAAANLVTTKDLWLKAATIAVPIAGGFILVLLVLLAIRMLKRDRENNSDYLPSNRSDFQIRCVWGKARQLQQQQQQQQQQVHRWKDVQPMLCGNGRNFPGKFAPLINSQQIQQPNSTAVYLPTLPKTAGHKKLWQKKSHIVFPRHHTVYNV